MKYVCFKCFSLWGVHQDIRLMYDNTYILRASEHFSEVLVSFLEDEQPLQGFASE